MIDERIAFSMAFAMTCAASVPVMFTSASTSSPQEDAYTVSIRTADLSELHAVIRMERNTGNAPRGPRPE